MARRDRAKHDAEKVLVGVITGVRGLGGDVWIKSFTANPEDVDRYGPVWDETGGRSLNLRVSGQVKGRVVAKIEGVDDRTAAEALRGHMLYVLRSAMPKPDEDEYYHVDLLGLRADLWRQEAEDDEPLGWVRAIHDFGAGAMIEIDGGTVGTLVVPFTREAVPLVDIAGGRLKIAPLPGLVEAAAEDESVADPEQPE